MSKTLEQIAEEYAKRNRYSVDSKEEDRIDIFLAGCRAVRAIVEEELKATQTNKSFSAVIKRPCVESALQNLLDKIGEV